MVLSPVSVSSHMLMNLHRVCSISFSPPTPSWSPLDVLEILHIHYFCSYSHLRSTPAFISASEWCQSPKLELQESPSTPPCNQSIWFCQCLPHSILTFHLHLLCLSLGLYYHRKAPTCTSSIPCYSSYTPSPQYHRNHYSWSRRPGPFTALCYRTCYSLPEI